MGRLVGDEAMARLFDSHVLVVGLGGVGSHAAEALARSGVGRLTLVDFDVVCVTNANRQVQALADTVGQAKANVLAERLRRINPMAQVRSVPLFFDDRIADQLLGGGREGPPDYVVDAIDNVTAKCQLLAACRARGLRVVCSTGASGRIDPTCVALADLAHTRTDRLAFAIRRILRKKHGFPRQGDFGIPAIYSTEPVREPVDLHYDQGQGFSCVCPKSESRQHHTCDDRNVILGTAGFVTATFGNVAASVVVRHLVGEPAYCSTG